MRQLSLENILARYLASHNEWRSHGYLSDTMKWKYVEKGVEKTYMAETVGRKLRKLESEGRIAVRQSNQSNEYKFIPVEHRKRYVPWSERPSDRKNVLFRQ